MVYTRVLRGERTLQRKLCFCYIYLMGHVFSKKMYVDLAIVKKCFQLKILQLITDIPFREHVIDLTNDFITL